MSRPAARPPVVRRAPACLAAVCLALVASAAAAQPAGPEPPTADAAVRSTVARLFDGMRAADTVAVRATLHPSARLLTAAVRDGQRALVPSPVAGFLAAVADAPVVYDERVEPGYPVLIDDGLAVAWVPYRFYAGDQFSHCGTNAFTLALGDDGWRVVQVVDTRRPDCPGD